ncbi:MAG: ABC transporter permease [Prevotella sp.]
MKKTKENNEENKVRSISSPLSLGEGSGVRLFSSYLRFLSRNKVYTVINVFGLSVSLMFVMLIGVYVWQEYRVTRDIPESERVEAIGMRFAGKELFGTHHYAGKQLQKMFPEIEAVCGVSKLELTLNKGDERFRAQVLSADSTFFTLFGYPLREGDAVRCLETKDAAVVSESFAMKYFGEKDVVGRTITFRDSLKFHVTAVMKDLDGRIFRNADMVVNYYNQCYGNYCDTDEAFLKRFVNLTGCSLFLRLREGKTFVGREKELVDCYASFWSDFAEQKPGDERYIQPYAMKYKDVYFSKTTDNGVMRFGDIMLVRILAAVALVILLFAVMNYVNLTVAQSGKRAREMAARRLFGAQRREIAMRFVGESLMLCALAFLLALLLTFAFAASFGELLGTKMNMSLMLSPMVIALLLAILLVTGILSGVVPAAVSSRVDPMEIVRGTFVHKTKMVFSRVFIVVQNIITITMLACSLVMVVQMKHLADAPLGFQQNNILTIDDVDSHERFKQELMKLPFVKLVTPSMGTPANGGNNQTVVNSEGFVDMKIQHFIVEKEFFDIYGLTLTDGSMPKPGMYYMNKSMENDVKASDAIRDPRNTLKKIHLLNHDFEEQYGGTLNDFRIRSIEEEQCQLLISVVDKVPYCWNLNILMEGDLEEGYNEIARLYHKFYHEELGEKQARFIDDQVQLAFEAQIRTSRIVSLFALVAILISMLGLIAMSTYFIEQRQKEIAVRKVFGSTNAQMHLRLVRTFLMYVVIAFVISVPIVLYFMKDWIIQYSYRITWWPWIAVAGAIILLISFAAVMVQSWVAANENPIKHIKDN